MEVVQYNRKHPAIEQNKSYKLSALINADSFFYGIVDESGQWVKTDNTSLDDSKLISSGDYPIKTGAIGIYNKHFTVISAKDFDHDQAGIYLKETMGTEVLEKNIKIDELDKSGAFICYEVSEYLLEYCKTNFSDYEVSHLVSNLIEHITVSPNEEVLHICKIGEDMIYLVFKYGLLSLANIVRPATANTILYYSTLIKEKLDFSDNNFRIELSGAFVYPGKISALLKNYFRNVTFCTVRDEQMQNAMEDTSVLFPLQSILRCA